MKSHRLIIKGGFLFIMAVLILSSSYTGMASADKAHTSKSNSTKKFYSVIMQDGADPWMYKHSDGFYYFTKTTGNNVTIWKSSTITGIDAAEKREIATGGQNVWAPEIHYLQGAWYIYYAKDDGDNANHRMYVMENTSADPMQGTWTDKGQITDTTNRWGIDGTAFEVKGQLYYIWSGWEGSENVSQRLYIARMSNPWTISSERVEIARPEYAWETNHQPNVNEGPQVYVKGRTINLLYSASGSWTNDYSLGLITADTRSDLLKPASWNKRDKPVFASANGVYGPGHASLTTSPDGREDWIIYHAAKFDGSGWNREIRAQEFDWNRDGTPDLDEPTAANEQVSLPSGEPKHTRYEAENAVFGGGAYASSSENGSRGSKAGHIDQPDSYAEYTIKIPADGSYILSARTANGTTGMDWSTLMLSVDGAAPTPFYITNKGWENWGLSTQLLELDRGQHTIRFSKGDGYGEIDFFDIAPVSGRK